MYKYGYQCYNEPYNIRTYHNHSAQVRDYSIKDRIKQPYLFIKPNVQ